MSRRWQPLLVLPTLLLLPWGCANDTNAGQPKATGTATPTGVGNTTSGGSAPQRTSASPEISTTTEPKTLSPEPVTTPTGSGSSGDLVYTQGQIDYFQEIVLGSEFGGSSETVKKWLKDINIRISGAPTDEDLETLDDVVADLNRVVSSVDIDLVEQDADINVYIVRSSEFKEYLPEYVDGNDGFFYYRYRESGELYQADIVVRSEGIEQRLRSHLLREELTQSIGLAKDSNTYPRSIFYQGTSLTEEYSAIDETIIEMLYRPEIKAGFTKQQVDSTFESQ